NMRAAIDRNDTRVTSLFLQGGMDWKLAWTEQAFSAGNTEVLRLLKIILLTRNDRRHGTKTLQITFMQRCE
ncbi:hypothetical protein, partial [Citrobacter freundii]|uniref:hypothetical protein n=1 Tax=Citrobacter freundii TaxID=546 RepID=UPI000FDFFDB7